MIQDRKTGSGAERKMGMTRKTNFDRYLEQHLSDPEFAERIGKAGEACDKVMRRPEALKITRCAKGAERGSGIWNPTSRIGRMGGELRIFRNPQAYVGEYSGGRT